MSLIRRKCLLQKVLNLKPGDLVQAHANCQHIFGITESHTDYKISVDTPQYLVYLGQVENFHYYEDLLSVSEFLYGEKIIHLLETAKLEILEIYKKIP